jgi:hypothetical protein
MPTYGATDVKFILTDGTRTVDLYEKSVDGVTCTPEGLSAVTYTPAQYDTDMTGSTGQTFTEKVELYLKGTSQDDTIATLKDIIALLRDAELYAYKSSKNKPVYLISKAYNETNERYALVTAASKIKSKPVVTERHFQQAYIMGPIEFTIERTIWRDAIPGVIGTAKSLTRVPAGTGAWEFATEQPLANYHDEHNISHIFVYDASGTSWSANQYGVLTTWNLFNAAPAVGDILYIGADDPFFNVMFYLGTAGVGTGVTFVYEYSDGAAGWPAMTLGTHLTLYPDTEPWIGKTGYIGLSWLGSNLTNAWAVETVNGVASKFWIRVRITAIATSFGTSPANLDVAAFNDRWNWIEVPAASIVGDAPPYTMLRLKAPAGGTQAVSFANHSRIIIGAKSRNLPTFRSNLNLGNDGNPAAWTCTYGTDASAAAGPQSTGGDHCAVTFATNITMVKRVTLTGVDVAASWVGEYRPFLRVTQSGGAAGDLAVRLRVVLDATTAYATSVNGPDVALKGTSALGGHYELVDLWPKDVLRIPFTRFMNADVLTNADLLFEIYASRGSGAATMLMYDLILIPIDEWSVVLDDPVTDIVNGSSALRGLTLLDDDSGVIEDRTVRSILSAAGGTVWPAETWSRHGLPLRLNPGVKHRIYFLAGHYPAGQAWGDKPLCSRPGMMLMASVFTHNVYFDVRGVT